MVSMMFNEIELSSVITDIAAGPFGSNLKVSCFVPYGFPIIDGANLKGFNGQAATFHQENTGG